MELSPGIISIFGMWLNSFQVDKYNYPRYKHLDGKIWLLFGIFNPMKILSLSDIVIDRIYSPWIQERFADVDCVISCGDLPYYYLEYILTALNVPLYYVRGNHAPIREISESGENPGPCGAIDLHTNVIRVQGLILAGIEGCLRYREGPFQYSQSEMWSYVLRLVPAFLINKVTYGRFLDIFVTHASPWEIHDQPDLPHQGIKAFRWLIQVFQPRYHFHGHIHVYRNGTIVETMVGKTTVINTYGYRETIF
jgi:Icc-related predicted phosphoesterase